MTRLSHDEYHLAEGNMSPQKSTFNQVNGFLDLYIENIMQNCFGIWKIESIPYELEGTNTKDVQLLAKSIVEKLDNEEYSPKNLVEQVYGMRFMRNYYTPTLKDSFILSALLILIIHS